jgi:YD repeat-containing protein
MKKFFSTLVICLLLTASCNKADLIRLSDSGVNLCSIKRISFFTNFFRDTITFVYNSLGNPTRGDRVNVGSGSPRYLFRYDRENRLQDFIGAYDNGAGEFWTRYAYSDNNRTVHDTTFTLVTEITSWPPTVAGEPEMTTHIKKYDADGRVIQSTTSFDNIVWGVINYSYDQQGNLTGQGVDNKINYHRTNKVWMFIDDQYSVNNVFPIDAYNNFGLPTKFNFNLQGAFPNSVLFMLQYPQTIIDYDCDVPKNLY